MENSSQYELQKGSKLKVKSYDSYCYSVNGILAGMVWVHLPRGHSLDTLGWDCLVAHELPGEM